MTKCRPNCVQQNVNIFYIFWSPQIRRIQTYCIRYTFCFIQWGVGCLVLETNQVLFLAEPLKFYGIIKEISSFDIFNLISFLTKNNVRQRVIKVFHSILTCPWLWWWCNFTANYILNSSAIPSPSQEPGPFKHYSEFTVFSLLANQSILQYHCDLFVYAIQLRKALELSSEHGYLIRICVGIWGGTDQGLYSTCRRCPEYSSQASPGGKIQLVPRLGCVFRGPVNDLLSHLGYLSRQVAGGRERRGVLLVW